MSQPLIIGAVGVAILDTTITDLTDHNTSNGPSFRIVIGGFVVMVGLLALSDAAEELADAMAILILVGTLVGPKGGALSTLVSKMVSKDYTPPASLGSPTPVLANPNAVFNLDPNKRSV